MADATASELARQLRVQHDALLELIDIALAAVRESGQSSVSSMHMTTRLNELGDSLRRAAAASVVRPHASAARR